MKKNLFYLSLLIFMGAIGICSCSSDPNSEDIVEPQTPETTVTPPVLEERKAINLSASQCNVAEELNKFNLSFTSDACRYVNMINGNSDSNVICSPLGAEMIMSMVLNAVEEDQQTEILNYLGITDIESLNSLNANLIRSLSNADKATKFNISNALWVNNEKIKGLNPDYSSLFTDTYGGHINFGNFNRDNKSIIEDINKWCASKTDGMIQQYLKELKSSSFAIVLNALSFSSYWNNELFSKEPLTNEVFHGTHNDSNVKMMHSDKCAIKTAEDELFYLISLPYGNEAFNMFILLPKSDLTDSEMLSYISWERISQLKNDARYELAKISMPKFNISSAINVSDLYYPPYFFPLFAIF